MFAKHRHGSLDAYYSQLGLELLSLHQHLEKLPPVWVELSAEQEQRFYTFFRRALAKYKAVQPEEFEATVMRLGLIAFRLCMLLTAFGIMDDGVVAEKMECSDRDFETVMSMIGVLFRHSSKVFNQLPEERRLMKKSNPKEVFLESLPAEFDRAYWVNLAASLNIKRPVQNRYFNPNATGEGL